MKYVVPSDWLSWVDYDEDSHFPIQNLPFGVFSHPAHPEERVPCVAIGEYVVDLVVLQKEGLIDTVELDNDYGLDPLIEAGQTAISELRKQLANLLHEDTESLQNNLDLQERCFFHQSDVQLHMPYTPRAFVDFYSGVHHASNVGRMFRPDQPPLLPNYTWIPIGYNGRASSVVPSGTPIRRPKCQTKGPNDDAPTFGPTRELDFELEMGYYLCGNTEMGSATPIGEVEDLIAGLVIVNDWSARDTQRWEYQPLGPFLAKSFATSISPWLVTLDALEPFRTQGMAQDPAPLDYLKPAGPGHFDIVLEVWLRSSKSDAPQLICTSNMANLYWSIFQQLAHQSSNGTPLETGDLYATGTISGEAEGSFGSMLELTWRGQKPVGLETGETRTFLEDGDEVIMRAYAQGDGFRVGFGECRGLVLSA